MVGLVALLFWPSMGIAASSLTPRLVPIKSQPEPPGCDPGHMIGLAVEESTALIVRGKRLSVAGRNKAHIFLKSADHDALTWHSLAAGDIGVVGTSPDGSHQLHFEEWSAADSSKLLGTIAVSVPLSCY